MTGGSGYLVAQYKVSRRGWGGLREEHSSVALTTVMVIVIRSPGKCIGRYVYLRMHVHAHRETSKNLVSNFTALSS